MKCNLPCVVYKQLTAGRKRDYLGQMFHDLYGDHNQVVQSAGIAANTSKHESSTIKDNTINKL